MKTDVLIVPNDTLLAGGTAADWASFDGRFPAGLFVSLLRTAYLSLHCAEGWGAYDAAYEQRARTAEDAEAAGVRVTAQLLATGVTGRLEPLYPVPDDLLVEPGPRDAVWAQPTYLEVVPSDVVSHDRKDLRLLAPSSRNMRVRPFDAYLTRKGVRIWADHKPQRLTEGEHYMPLRRLFDVELRSEPVSPGQRAIAPHVRLKSGIGFLMSLDIPDGHGPLALPLTIRAGRSQTARLEEAQVPQPTFDTKPRKRWRICTLTSIKAGPTGLPPWIDENDLSTRAPFPTGGKLVAVARRGFERPFDGVRGMRLAETTHAFVPVGATFFIEYDEPVLIEQSADILAGGS